MNQRQLNILEMLNKDEELDVNELANKLSVSAVTVRKDLALLEGRGLLKRQHGYAVRVSSNDVGYRMTYDYEIKRRIALHACETVEHGETVMIESGSTCAMLAEELVKNKCDITIITNSAFIADYVRGIPGARIVLLGGAYNPNSQVMTGPLVKKCAGEFYVDKFFIGVDGYRPEDGWFSNIDISRAEAVREMAARAEKRIVLTDSSKFNKKGIVSLLPASEVTAVITDLVPDNCRVLLEKDGVEIIIAK